MGPDHLLQPGAAQVELEPGLDRVRVDFRQGAGALVRAQQFTHEQRIARGHGQDAAQQRAGPPAGLVVHQALDHHRAHRRQPQPCLRLIDEHRQRLAIRIRAGRDQQGERQAPAGPDQPTDQRQRGRVEVVRVLDAQHDRAVGAQLVDPVERRLTQIPGTGPVTQKRPGTGERVVVPARLARHAKDLCRTGRDGIEDRAGQEGLPDTRRALDDDAHPSWRVPFGHGEDQVAGGLLDGGTIRRW